MDLMKRAWKSTKVKWGRSLLLFTMFTVIPTFVLAGLAVRNIAEEAADQAQEEVGATVILSANRGASFKKQEQTSSNNSAVEERPDPDNFSLTPVSLMDTERVAKLGNIKGCSFENPASAMARERIVAVTSSDSGEDSSKTTDAGGGPAEGMGKSPQMIRADFQISGVSAAAQNSTFSDGTAKITDGGGIDNSDKGTNNVVIDSTLTETNDLTIGNTFMITNTEGENTTYEVTVKGVYESSETSSSMGMKLNFMNLSDIPCTSYTFANKLNEISNDSTIDSAIYILSDPDEMDEFPEKAERLIDTDTLSLQTDDSVHQPMLEPLNNAASLSRNVVLLMAVAGIIILTLIIMTIIRERWYELSVLLSLGESRSKIILQLFTKVATCMILALGVASISGNIVANAVGQQLLDQQTEATIQD